ncbi:MAG: rhodanese-like domain-containing protein [Chloroflexota bacterium]|nr:rhodanese-like domain-containing protein [Chloroflexota bacterium]
MIVDRVYTPGLAQVAYLVADEQSGEAAVIDPRRDVDEYLSWAETRGYRIVAILETHVHADFVTGAQELATATGATVHANRRGESGFPHRPLDDGDEIAVGRLILQAVWTPGHTPEHMSYLLFDPASGTGPVALFSGDTLFAGEVGRPDLLGEEQTRNLAEQLYDTFAERLAPLADAVVVYPGHTAGSACGRKIGDAPHTTLGTERQFNYALQAGSREEFVSLVLAGMPKPPTYYPVLKRINKAGPAPLASLAEGEALGPEAVAWSQAEGARVIDARSADAFGIAHIPGAVFAGLGLNFTAWMGWLAPYDRDLILVLDDDRFAEAQTELRRIGLDRVAGYLVGGLPAWRAAGYEVAALDQITVQKLAQQLEAAHEGLVVLDVRRDDEWEMGHIAGARHLFAGEIVQGAAPPIDGASPVAVICASGYRSSVAASTLQARGYENVINVCGGMDAWIEAGLPVTRE